MNEETQEIIICPNCGGIDFAIHSQQNIVTRFSKDGTAKTTDETPYYNQEPEIYCADGCGDDVDYYPNITKEEIKALLSFTDEERIELTEYYQGEIYGLKEAIKKLKGKTGKEWESTFNKIKLLEEIKK